jgi:uncharacterized protein YejL (UPF0352 family)
MEKVAEINCVEEKKKAMKILEDEKRKRSEECNREIKAVLEKHNCMVNCSVVVSGNRHPESIIQIVPM